MLNKDKLNKINVFPVADGDTGSNLVFTMNSVIDYAQVKDSVHETLLSMSEASIYGARGNSGVIFSQYISGLAEQTKGKKYVYLKDFAAASLESAHGIYKAISNPVEGTMVTVIKEWSAYINENHHRFEFFDELFENSIEIAFKSLEATKEKLEVLRKNNVVDSGAKGFVIFLQGILKYLKGYNIDFVKDRTGIGVDISNEHEYSEDIKYRYCTECILKGEELDVSSIKNDIEKFGDSLIVAGSEKFKHIHIHTDNVKGFFKAISKHGDVSRPKVDDMVFQYKLKGEKKKIGIVTDSIADIPQSMMEDKDIHLIPINILVGDSVYLDKTTISSGDFYDIMNYSSIYPSSSQPNDVDIKNKLDWLSSAYDSLIVISVSSKLSGTYDSFLRYSNSLRDKGYDIRLVDSKLNSAAQGLLVLEVVDMIEKGLVMDEIVSRAEEIISRTEIYVALDTFKNSLKSGRVPKIVGKIGTAFKLRPIISLDRDGKGAAFSIAISKRVLMRKIINLIKTRHASVVIKKYSVVHSGDEDGAKKFAEKIEAIVGVPPVYICEISSVTALHAGENAVAIGFLREN